MIRPSFGPDEFHAPAPHYRIDIEGRRLLYAYIRKNASSAFKLLIGRRRHPRWMIRRMLRRTRGGRHDLHGNLASWQVPPEAIGSSGFDDIFFVYRDPAARFVSLFLNKFVDGARSRGLWRDFSRAMNATSLEAVTLRDFMRWAERPFHELNPHLWPQKAHLLEITYTRAIALPELPDAMVELIGPEAARRWFGRRVNASSPTGGTRPGGLATAARRGVESAEPLLLDCPVVELRSLRAAGEPVDALRLSTAELHEFVLRRYAADVAWIRHLSGLG